MQIANLALIAAAKQLNQSDIAKMAGVSRQAVSSWFAAEGGVADVRSRNLERLATALDVGADDLLRPLPGFGADERAELAARYLWDRLYPSVEAFLVALAAGEERALARLVDRAGLFAAARIAGPAVWTRFHGYARLLPPGRRRALERLWTLQHDRAAS